MHFNGLIRLLESTNIDDFKNDCNKIIDVEDNNPRFRSGISLFEDSRWALFEISYKHAPSLTSYIEPPGSYYKIVDSILDKIGRNYYVVSSMLAWVNPGSKISKHVDLQRVYANTRRIHIVIERPNLAYTSSYAGSVKHDFKFDVGATYELNNRVYHSVDNPVQQGRFVLLIIDFAEQGVTFKEEDNVIKDMNLLDSSNLELYA
jgi:hypothetical protein